MDNLLAGLNKEPPAATPPTEAEHAEVEQTPPEEAAGSPDEPPEAPSLKAYAEEHGLDLKELYGLELSDGNTLGQISNQSKALKSLTDDRETFEAEKAESRIKTAAKTEQLSEYLTLLDKGELTPEALEGLRVAQRAGLEAEQRQLLAVLPEWKDTTARSVDVELMVAHLAPFGFVADDLGKVADHRLIKYIHFNATREQRAKLALKAASTSKPKGTAHVDGKAGQGGVDLKALIEGAK